MTENMKKEIISAVKWTWIICAAAGAYYLVTPKYFIMNKGPMYQVNKITGEVRECYETDKTGKLIFTWPDNS